MIQALGPYHSIYCTILFYDSCLKGKVYWRRRLPPERTPKTSYTWLSPRFTKQLPLSMLPYQKIFYETPFLLNLSVLLLFVMSVEIYSFLSLCEKPHKSVWKSVLKFHFLLKKEGGVSGRRRTLMKFCMSEIWSDSLLPKELSYKTTYTTFVTTKWTPVSAKTSGTG